MSTEMLSRSVRYAAWSVPAIAGLMILSAAPALAQTARISESGAIVNITASGERVKAAGAMVSVEGAAESVVAAGASVAVRGTVSQDVKAAGAIVIVNAAVGGPVRVGGANVTIGPGSDIGQGLKAFGANVTVFGKIKGAVKIAAAVVTFNAQTDTDVTIYGSRIVIRAPARIGGDLIVWSRFEPVIAEGAVIAGEVRKLEPQRWWWPISPWAWALSLVVAISAGTVLAGIVLLLFGGRVFVTATDHVRLRPGSSILIGVATAILLPLIAAILMATVIGLTAGLAILLVLPLLVVFGHAVAAAGVAGGVFVRRRGQIGAFATFILLVIGAVMIALIALIPWVGPLFIGIVLLLGTGALTRTLGARIRRAEPKPV